jgi:hypothetical protein
MSPPQKTTDPGSNFYATDNSQICQSVVEIRNLIKMVNDDLARQQYFAVY